MVARGAASGPKAWAGLATIVREVSGLRQAAADAGTTRPGAGCSCEVMRPKPWPWLRAATNAPRSTLAALEPLPETGDLWKAGNAESGTHNDPADWVRRVEGILGLHPVKGYPGIAERAPLAGRTALVRPPVVPQLTSAKRGKGV